MNESLFPIINPEEEELIKKRIELESHEINLTQKELELQTLINEINEFENLYHTVIGMRYSEIENLENQIEEYLRYIEEVKACKPTESLKKLYRDIAKKIHPDLAVNDDDRQKRQEFMAMVNEAYENGDEEKLKKIFTEWQKSPDSIITDDVGGQLVKVIRQISQILNRISAIDEEIDDIRSRELFQLMKKSKIANQNGIDLLGSISQKLDKEIDSLQKKLSNIKNNIN